MTQYNEWRSLVDLQVYNDIPDSDMYQDIDFVADTWFKFYEIDEGRPISDGYNLENHVVGEGWTDDTYNETHGEQGQYKVEEREGDGFYWITAESTGGGDTRSWGVSTVLQFSQLSTIEYRVSANDTGRFSSGYEIGIQGEAFESVQSSVSDTERSIDVSHVTEDQEFYIFADGNGSYDGGTRCSITELDQITD